MLLNDLYTIQSINKSEAGIDAIINIDAAHAIFGGHFPGQPVVPGVCMMQMVEEIATEAIGKKLVLKKADDLKFLVVIDPTQNNIISVKLATKQNDDDTIYITASLFNDTIIHAKIKSLYAIQ